MVSETKIDDSFPIGNFLIHGFSPPYSFDCESKGGGIMLYIRGDIPSNFLSTAYRESLCWTKSTEWKVFDILFL